MKYVFFVAVLFTVCGCSYQKNKPLSDNQHVSLTLATEHLQISPSNNVLELKSYNITSPFYSDSMECIVGYNYRQHSLDLIRLGEQGNISSILLQREGPDGIPGSISSICSVSKDSIWVYDGIAMYLLNNSGKVVEKVSPENRASIIIDANYAMSTAKFSYNKERHSLLYLAKRDSFVVEEYDIQRKQISDTHTLSYSKVNPNGSLAYGDMDAPNINFVGNKVVYNYPYESTVYLLDMVTGKQSIIDAQSRYTSNEAQKCSANGYAAWEKHRIENVHFYDIMYLPGSRVYVRLHIGGIEFDTQKPVPALLDSRPIYMMAFDEDFKIIGESKLPEQKYSCFTGWCPLSKAILFFNENSLSESIDYDNLNMDIISL